MWRSSDLMAKVKTTLRSHWQPNWYRGTICTVHVHLPLFVASGQDHGWCVCCYSLTMVMTYNVVQTLWSNCTHVLHTGGHLYYRWPLVLQVGTCTTGGHLYYRWPLVLQVATCTTGGHLYYRWPLVLQVGTC